MDRFRTTRADGGAAVTGPSDGSRAAKKAVGCRPEAILTALFLALALAAGANCGYRLRGTGSSLPPSVRTMCIPVFRNLTTRYELDVKLTRAVIDEMVARGKVRILSERDKADSVLEGEIVSFTATPIAFTGQGRADRYNVTVTTRITLRDRLTEKVIFSSPSFIYVQEYEVPEGKDFESLETEALDKIAGRFARSLVVSILEGF